MVAARLRARAGRRGAGSDLSLEQRGRVLLHPRALERRRLPRRERGGPREDRRRAPRARVHGRDARRATGARARARCTRPGRPRSSARPDRRGRPLHLHLHVRHDRAAEGLHDPEPELLRDGGEDPRGRGLLPPDRRDAALPAARPQLRPAHAPARRAPRLHDRFLPRPAANRRGPAGGSPDDPADGAARPREGAHRGLRRTSPPQPASSGG